MIAKFVIFFGLVAAATAIAVPVGPAQVTYAHAPAPVTYAHAPAPVTYAHAPAPVTYAHAPAPIAYAHAPAQVAYAQAPLVKTVYAEPEAPAHYQYSYSVQDGHTGDVKQQQEQRDGDAVHGSYSLIQPDGVQRTVEYTSDKVNGFNAVVRYEGTPVHPAPAKVAVAAAPVAKIAYAPAPVAKIAYAPAPVARVAYAAAPAPFGYAHAPAPHAYAPAPIAYAQAPVAKVAYATAPVAKVAYAQNLGHVTFSSPAVSYQH